MRQVATIVLDRRSCFDFAFATLSTNDTLPCPGFCPLALSVAV